MDTDAFDDHRFWSVDVAYAKAAPTDVLARITVTNHGPDVATISVLPTLWFRNTWRVAGAETPALILERDGIVVDHPRLAGYRLDAAPVDGVAPQPLFCDNETNTARLFGAAAITPFPKDGINDHVTSGADTVNPEERGTKASLWYRLTVPAGGSAEVRLRLHRPAAGDGAAVSGPWHAGFFEDVMATREREQTTISRRLWPAELASATYSC